MKFGIMLAIIFLIVAGSAVLSIAWADSQSPETSGVPSPDDVPDTIAGHEVIAVITIEDDPCIVDPFRIILRSEQLSINELFDSKEPQDIRSALNELGMTDIPYGIISDGADAEKYRQSVLEHGRLNKEQGCPRLFGPRPPIKGRTPAQ